jgi:AP-3 complex subunit beta
MSKVRLELARLISRCFPELEPDEKQQAIHFASKLWIYRAYSESISSNMGSPSSESAICEHILSMGRMDVNPDVKDRARFESCVLQSSVGLKHDTDGLDERPGSAGLTIGNAKKILLPNKPTPSYLPIDDGATVDMSSFRFGTLSSLVGHRARGAYLPLPPWAERNSPSSLREPIEVAKEQLAQNFMDPSQPQRPGTSGFYADDKDDESDSSDSSSTSSSESDGQNADSESDSESDDDSSSDDSDDIDLLMPKLQVNGNVQTSSLLQMNSPPSSMPKVPAFQTHLSSQASSNDEFSSDSDSDSDSDSSSSDENYNGDVSSANLLSLTTPQPAQMKGSIDMFSMMSSSGFAPVPEVSSRAASSALEDLKGLVMAPISIEETKARGPDLERDSSAWTQLVRPELCGGLSVRARYLRGATKERELQMMNIIPSNPRLVCVQIQFGNK